MTENEIFEKWLLIKWIPTEANFIYGINDAWGIGEYYDTQEEAKDAMMAEIDTHQHLSACDIDEYGSFYGILYAERTEDGIYAFYFIKCCSDEVRQKLVECENYRSEIAMLRSAIDSKDNQINYRDDCVKKQRSMLKKYKDKLDSLHSERSDANEDDYRAKESYYTEVLKSKQHRIDVLEEENQKLVQEYIEIERALKQRDEILAQIRDVIYPF